MRTLICCLVVASLSVAAEKTDREKIQGAWACESATQAKGPRPEATAKAIRLTFDGDDMTMVNMAGGPKHAFAFKLDEGRKPKEITLKFAEGNVEIKGVYALDGDVLKVCLSTAKDDRPKGLEPAKGTAQMLMVFNREK